MQGKLIDTLASVVQSRTEFEDFRAALMQTVEIEDGEEGASLIRVGIGVNYLEVTTTTLAFVGGGNRIDLEELSRIKLLFEDIKQRLMLPFTGGTDEDYDIDVWVDGAPTMPNEIIGGWEPSSGSGGAGIDDDTIGVNTTWSSYKITLELSNKVNTSDARLSDARNPLPHNHVVADIQELATTLNGFQFGGSAPASPANGMQWFEVGSYFPQPWVWSSADNLWLSNTILFDFGWPSFNIGTSGNISFVNKAVPFYNNTSNRIRLEHIFGLYSTQLSTAAHDASNYYAFKIKYFRGTDTNPVDLFSIPENTQSMTITGATRFRRVTQTPGLWLPGNTWYMQLEAQRLGGGTTTGVTCFAGMMAYLRFARP